MAIGAAKTQFVASDIQIVGEYGVTITPGSMVVFSSGGANTSPTAYSNVINGVGPFTYLWTITGSDISINSPVLANTYFAASGFNSSHTETATLTVTDTGNGNAETSQDLSVTFIFEQ